MIGDDGAMIAGSRVRWSRWLVAVVLPLVALESPALARPCPPCVDRLCVDDEQAQQAYAEKRARLLDSGAPPRLVDSLLARTARCEHCLRSLPDALHILLVYPNGTRWSFAYSKYDEKLARDELRTGKITAFHIFIASDPCACCGQLEPKEDPVTALVPGETDSFTRPAALGADPADLTGASQPPPYAFPPDLPHPAPVTAPCPECVALAEQRNKAAEAAWLAEHTWRRHVAEQEWDYRRATYALDRGDPKGAAKATRAARDWQVKVDQAAAEMALAKKAQEKAEAALAECRRRCLGAAIPPPPPPIRWRPSGSIDARLGPSLILHGPGGNQLAVAVMARLRVLPRDLPGYLTFQPFVTVLGGSTAIGIPVGFEYDYQVGRSDFFLYARLGVGYVAWLFPESRGTNRVDAALILPEAGARYELPRLPVHFGIDLVGLPIYVYAGGAAVSYRIMAWAGWLFGR